MLTPPMLNCLNPGTYSPVFNMPWRHYVYGISRRRLLSLECARFFRYGCTSAVCHFAQSHIVSCAHA